MPRCLLWCASADGLLETGDLAAHGLGARGGDGFAFGGSGQGIPQFGSGGFALAFGWTEIEIIDAALIKNHLLGRKQNDFRGDARAGLFGKTLLLVEQSSGPDLEQFFMLHDLSEFEVAFRVNQKKGEAIFKSFRDGVDLGKKGVGGIAERRAEDEHDPLFVGGDFERRMICAIGAWQRDVWLRSAQSHTDTDEQGQEKQGKTHDAASEAQTGGLATRKAVPSMNGEKESFEFSRKRPFPEVPMSTPAGPRPWIIAETNWKHVEATEYELAVLPWGATEAHNWHLPYATDNIQVEAIAAEAGRLAWEAGAKVAVLPTIPFGVQTGQLDIPFCINMNPSTQMAVLDDIIDSLVGVGVPKLVVLNGHGGNDFKQMLRELQARHPTIFLCTVSWFQADRGDGIFDIIGDHADERETSLILHLTPEWVLPKSEWGAGKDNLWTLPAMREKWAWAQRAWTQATNDTGSGDPQHATAEKGARYFEVLSRKIGGFFQDLARVDVTQMYAPEEA